MVYIISMTTLTTSAKVLVSAGVIALLAFLQIGVAQQLVSESAPTLFTLRSPLLIAMSIVQVIFGAWALLDVSKKIKEDDGPVLRKHTPAPKHAK
jgi:hypothetical protein